MRTLCFIRKELRGQQTTRIVNPAKADQPRSLQVELAMVLCYREEVELTGIGKCSPGLSPVGLKKYHQYMKKNPKKIQLRTPVKEISSRDHLCYLCTIPSIIRCIIFLQGKK